jgi:hypothetical protein
MITLNLDSTLNLSDETSIMALDWGGYLTQMHDGFTAIVRESR